MKRRRGSGGMGSLDSLLDTMTNVVGILVIVLVVAQLNVQSTVNRIRENLPEVSTDQLAQQEKSVRQLQAQLVAMTDGNRDAARQVELEQKRLGILQKEAKDLQTQTRVAAKPNNPGALETRLAALKKDHDYRDALADEIKTYITELEQKVTDTPLPQAAPARKVRLPNPRPAPEGATEFLFLCKGNRVIPVDRQTIFEATRRKIYRLGRAVWHGSSPKKPGRPEEIIFDPRKLKTAFDKTPFMSRLFHIKMRPREELTVMQIELHVRENAGETREQIVAGRSAFQSRLYQMKQEKQYAMFVVWPDSFEVYEAARAICDFRKIPAGWRPMPWSVQVFTLPKLKTFRYKEPPPPPDKPAPKPAGKPNVLD